MDIDKDSKVVESPLGASTDSGPGGVVRFDARSGLRCDVRTAAGKLRISRGEGPSCEVRMSTSDPDPERRLAQVECVYDESTNQLLVDTKAGQLPGGPAVGIKKVWTRWFNTVRHDVDIELLVAVDASLKFRSASGDLRASVELDDVEVATASGDVALGEVKGSVKLRSASGDLVTAAVGGSVESKTVSGDVLVDRVSGDVDVQTVSGDVSLTMDKAVDARINTVSGDVMAGVAVGLLIDVDANTVSGELASEISLESGHGGSTEEALRLKVRTVSGDVRIRRN